MTDVRMSKLSLWGFLVTAFVIGAAIGLGVLLWQRTVLLSDMRALERKLDSAETSAAAGAVRIEDLQGRLRSTESSVASLVTLNSQLASDLASATAALTAAVTEGTVTVKERSVSPTSVEANKPLTLVAKVQGKADKVQMKIAGTGYSKVYNLTKSSSSGDIDTWKRTVTSPSAKGVYRYYATAYVGSKAFEMAGTSGWTFEVK